MAKKKQNKTAKKAAAKAPAKPAAKPGKRAKSAKASTSSKPSKPSKPAKASKSAKSAGATEVGQFRINTGGGASPAEIGADLVALFNAGKADEVDHKWWSDAIVSVEGDGQAWGGRQAVVGKNEWWYSQHEILGGSAEGPFVGGSGFAVRFRMHVRVKQSGQEIHMDEVGVYTVKNGRIVREEFMYGG